MLTFRDATCFPTKWLLKNERRNSIVMTCHYPNLGSAYDWNKGEFCLIGCFDFIVFSGFLTARK